MSIFNKIYLNYKCYIFIIDIAFYMILIGDWGLGIGDWGLGIGPNPQSPIPNPQSPIPILIINIKNKLIKYKRINII
jgi:hypothetical protein